MREGKRSEESFFWKWGNNTGKVIMNVCKQVPETAHETPLEEFHDQASRSNKN